jgi:hypothetical protein
MATQVNQINFDILDDMIEHLPGKWLPRDADAEEYSLGMGCILNQAAHSRIRLGTHAVDFVKQVAWQHELRYVILDLFPDRDEDGSRGIVEFNDHPDTTEEDVLLALKHTRERLISQ